MMVSFIDQHRNEKGVESICKELPIAPSTYYQTKVCQADPTRHSARHKRDLFLQDEVYRVWDENHQVYGAHKLWHQLKREGFQIARCTVERLMHVIGIQGVVRGKVKRTTIPVDTDPRPLDLVQRSFRADRPNQLWVADFTYVSTWTGFVFVAFVIDVFSRMIVGWRVSRQMTADLTLDALEQALWARKVKGGLIHHSDRGSQYLAIRYTERLEAAGIEASVGSVGDAYDNALAETINGLFKTEVIHRCGPWKSFDAVEYATLEWVHWFNNKRLLEPIGNIPPVEFEEAYYTGQNSPTLVAGLT
jgi:transposase InsO family protein